MNLSRRQFNFCAVGGASAFLAGCGGASSTEVAGRSAAPNQPTPQPREVSLMFHESNEFYDRLNAAMDQSANVTLTFDGMNLIKKESRLMKDFLEKTANCDRFADEILDKEKNDAGRKGLKQVFAPELLKHEPTTEPAKLHGSEVIDPGTVMLVLGILLILASVSVAHAELIRGRKYYVRMHATGNGMELIFEGGQ